MTTELMLRRKWTFRAHGRQVVFVKRPNEKAEHVLMKAFLWALYLPTYPSSAVELAIGDRYKPDVVALNPEGIPLFWGEAGQVGMDKIRSLGKRYPTTHFAIAKWSTRLELVEGTVREALDDIPRSGPWDLLCFPRDSAERFIDPHGEIRLTHEHLEWIRLE